MSDGHSDAKRWSRWSDPSKIAAKEKLEKTYVVIPGHGAVPINDIRLLYSDTEPTKEELTNKQLSRSLSDLVVYLVDKGVF